jgi:ABC-type Fe3+-hydroxamate transport system substrate-binding protein
MRVVSLLPSATEILCRIGGRSMLIGRSHECDFPLGLDHIPVLTGQRTPHFGSEASSLEIDRSVRAALRAGESLYTLDVDRLRELKPDVILTQDLCEVCSIDLPTVQRVAHEMDPAPTVISLDPKSVWGVLDDLLLVGAAVGLEREAELAMVELRDAWWTAVDFVNPFQEGPEVLFLEWMNPTFVGGHWTPELIHAAGARHSLNSAGSKSRVATAEEIVASAPDRVIICPCGLALPAIEAELPALIAQPWWGVLPATLDRGRVALVDGNQMFNRPGPRLVDAFRWMVGWLNDRPELMPPDFPVVYR